MLFNFVLISNYDFNAYDVADDQIRNSGFINKISTDFSGSSSFKEVKLAFHYAPFVAN